jgi:hypothetical protein
VVAQANAVCGLLSEALASLFFGDIRLHLSPYFKEREGYSLAHQIFVEFTVYLRNANANAITCAGADTDADGAAGAGADFGADGTATEEAYLPSDSPIPLMDQPWARTLTVLAAAADPQRQRQRQSQGQSQGQRQRQRQRGRFPELLHAISALKSRIAHCSAAVDGRDPLTAAEEAQQGIPEQLLDLTQRMACLSFQDLSGLFPHVHRSVQHYMEPHNTASSHPAAAAATAVHSTSASAVMCLDEGPGPLQSALSALSMNIGQLLHIRPETFIAYLMAYACHERTALPVHDSTDASTDAQASGGTLLQLSRSYRSRSTCTSHSNNSTSRSIHAALLFALDMSLLTALPGLFAAETTTISATGGTPDTPSDTHSLSSGSLAGSPEASRCVADVKCRSLLNDISEILSIWGDPSIAAAEHPTESSIPVAQVCHHGDEDTAGMTAVPGGTDLSSPRWHDADDWVLHLDETTGNQYMYSATLDESRWVDHE